ncbi:MAG TPA: DUF4339 domain-containing protein [Tepidisphaeraceae bacterium]|nr:DUF4339 domain-containing protein [Tepidisphaeraceae bacterium]
MSTEWYYSQGGQQIGPITSQQMKDLAAGGQLTPNDLVWKDGMPEWTPASRVRGLFPGGAGGGVATAAPPQQGYAQPGAYAQPAPGNADYAYAQQAQGGQIGYYSPTSDINERTRRILANIPPVTGPRGDWPLSDQHLAQFAATERHRVPIRGFNVMCRILMIVYIVAACFVTYGVIQISSSPFRRSGEAMAYALVSLLTTVALAVIYPLAGGAAMKCRTWGPIVSIVINSLGVLWVLYQMVQVMSSPFAPGEAILFLLIPLLILGLFIFVSVRAMIAIPKFLSGPVWVVEAMINAKTQ